MTEAYIGEIRLFPLAFAPRGWLRCDGQTLPINQYQALYAIIGTTYGGNGVSTLRLPDLRGRVAVHPGGTVVLGQSSGEATHALTLNEIPPHAHTANASTVQAGEASAAGNIWGAASSPTYSKEGDTALAAHAIGTAGSSRPHQNMQPTLIVSFCICIQGEFPPRN